MRSRSTGELGLPILGGVEDVENVNLFIVEIVHRDMAVPLSPAPDDDVSQIRPRRDRLSICVIARQIGDVFRQITKISVGVGDAVTTGVP